MYFSFQLLYCSSLFFKFSSPLNISCDFSLYASFFVVVSPEILDHLNYPRSCLLSLLIFFSGRLPIFTSVSCSSGILSCSLVWNKYLCHLILSSFLCLRFSPLKVTALYPLLLLVSISQWVKMIQGLYKSFLVGGTDSCSMVGEAGSCSSGEQCQVEGM